MVHENYITGFSEKIIVYTKWGMMGPNMKRPYNSGFALRIFFFLNCLNILSAMSF